MTTKFILYLAGTIFGISPTVGSKATAKSENNNIIPIHYVLSMEFSGPQSYNGSVAMYFNARAAKPSVRMHATQKLNITSALLHRHSKEAPEEPEDTTHVGDEIILNFGEPFNVTRLHWIEMSFNTILQYSPPGTSQGLKFEMPSAPDGRDVAEKYVNGEPYLISTSFQMQHARDAFPCIDDPPLKATFQLCLTHPDDAVSESNTPRADRLLLGSGMVKQCFKNTHCMPTYLLAFAVARGMTTLERTVVTHFNKTLNFSVWYFNLTDSNKPKETSTNGGSNASMHLGSVEPMYTELVEPGRAGDMDDLEDTMMGLVGESLNSTNLYFKETDFSAVFGSLPPARYQGSYATEAYVEGQLENITEVIIETEKYFKLPLNLEKLTFVVHSLRASGLEGQLAGPYGIENHGLVGLDVSLLKKSTIIHELVHHFIGNIITVHTWSHMDFQEGLTEYVTRIIYENVYSPGHQDSFVVLLDSAQRLKYGSKQPGRFQNIHDVLAKGYQRSAHIFTMLERITNRTFVQGIIHKMINDRFLRSASWGTFESMLNRSGAENLSQFFHRWHVLPAFPVVTVTREIKQRPASNRSYSLFHLDQYPIGLNESTQDPGSNFYLYLEFLEAGKNGTAGPYSSFLATEFPLTLEREDVGAIIIANPFQTSIQLTVYGTNLYHEIFTSLRENSGFPSLPWKNWLSIVNQFFVALSMNLIPVEDDPNPILLRENLKIACMFDLDERSYGDYVCNCFDSMQLIPWADCIMYRYGRYMPDTAVPVEG